NDALIGKDRAIDDALRKAVEQAVGTMVSSETMVQNFQTLNDQIYTQSQGYVQNYKVLSENQRANVYEVTIQASVATGPIKEKLEALGFLLQQVGMPRIMILVAEQNIGRESYTYWWGAQRGGQVNLNIAENTIMDRFREKGFDLVDPQAQDIKVPPALQVMELNDRGAITLGKQVEAEIVIVGKALAKTVGSIAGTSMKSAQANISLKAIQIDNGRVLSAGSEIGAAVHIDEVTAGTEAIKKASAKMSDKLMDDIIKNFQKRIASTTRVQLTIFGLAGAEELRKFKSSVLGQVRGIEGAYERSFTENVAKMDVDIKGSTQILSQEISRRTFPEFVIKVIRSTWNTLELQVSAR
ncbi:MAG TPA: flagellar assembly protein T N-terminal domain-containing protein, partial [Thermodesulfobacteriota bacterium]|nr:flagellar assembly protein T N-terminal domain-containing protein [Thermodesulfobacteriota bacterium]